MSDHFTDPLVIALESAALALPEVTETGACLRRAFKVKTKGFVYLGQKPDEISVMVKLGPSIPAAEALAAQRTEIVVGKGRWVTIKLAPGASLAGADLDSWLRESYREQAPAKLADLVQ